jgi:hypothetical protein
MAERGNPTTRADGAVRRSQVLRFRLGWDVRQWPRLKVPPATMISMMWSSTIGAVVRQHRLPHEHVGQGSGDRRDAHADARHEQPVRPRGAGDVRAEDLERAGRAGQEAGGARAGGRRR